MKPFLTALLVFSGVFFGVFFGVATAQTSYRLTVFVNDAPVAWTLSDGNRKEGEARDGGFRTDRDAVTILFEGGKLSLNLADWGRFDYAHVLGATFAQTAADTYTVSATVRHDDKGWDDYADAFEVRGEQVENGLRELLHPHDEEQPFTRSQSGVRASGEVWLEAKTNVAGLGGSKIYVDLQAFEQTDFKQADGVRIAYELTVLP